MIFITGGKYQEKLDYAISRFGLSKADIRDGSMCPVEEAFSGRALFNLHILVLRLLQAGKDAEATIGRELEADSPLEVLICDELGCGIVPLEEKDRILRETVGRISCEAARRADTVIRMICGLPQTIKNIYPERILD